MAIYLVKTKSGTPYYWGSNLPNWQGGFTAKTGQTVLSSSQISLEQAPAGLRATLTPYATSAAPNVPQTYQQPKSAEAVQPYLTTFQEDQLAKETKSAVQTREEISAEVKAEVTPETPAPTTPKLVDIYGEMRTAQGVTELEEQLVDLKAQEEDLVAQKRQAGFAEEGKPVALNVIAGRVSEEERAFNERIDVVQRSKARLTDELNMRYQTINILMDLTQKDYANAVADYDRQFNQNIQVMNLVRGIQEDQKTEDQRTLDNARANLTIYSNLITKGNMDITNLNADQRLELAKMEVRAGFEPGFLASIKKDPDADIIATTTLDDGRIQIFTRNSNGEVASQIYGTKVPKTYAPTQPKTPTEAETKRAATSEMNSLLKAATGSDGKVHQNTYRNAKSQWIGGGWGSGKDFDDLFASQYVNFSHYQDYGVSQDYEPGR